MGLIIDTSIIIASERGLIDFSKWSNYDEAYISPITVSELLIGVDRASSEARRIKRSAFVEHVINAIAIVHFGIEEARIYAQIIHNLFQSNLTIGTHDMLIASSAIALGYPVLTINARDFQKIKGVEVLSVSVEK